MCKTMEDMRDKARAEGREEGRAEGREEGRAEGREEGKAEGRTEGMNLFALLIKRLSELGRTEDIEKAAADAAYRNQLLVELSIQ